MDLTIIPVDKLIVKDGAPLFFDYTALDNFHAIQWHGSSGDIEYTDGSHEGIADISALQSYIDAYDAEAKRLYDLAHPTYTLAQQLQKAKDARNVELNNALDTALNGGIIYKGNIYDSDAVSRNNLSGTLAAVGAGVTLPSGFKWRTANNTNVPMTDADLKGLGNAMLDFVNVQYQKAWTLKDQVNNATTVADVQAIVWE